MDYAEYPKIIERAQLLSRSGNRIRLHLLMKEEKMKWINKLLLSIVWVGLVASCSDDDSHELPVISPVSTGTFTDTRDDNTYNYVRIGNLNG